MERTRPCFLDKVGYKGTMTEGDEKVSRGMYFCLRERLVYIGLLIRP